MASKSLNRTKAFISCHKINTVAGVRSGILMSGYGWIGSGVVTLFTWYIIRVRNIPSTNPDGTLVLGIFVLILGAMILLFRRNINSLIDAKQKEIEARKHAQSNGEGGSKPPITPQQSK